MSTKLVPLTTRPLSTSRQGMTRLSSTGARGRPLAAHVEHLVRLVDREAAFVDGLARDDARQVRQAQIAQRSQVVEGRDPAGVDPAAADDARDPPDLVQVG